MDSGMRKDLVLLPTLRLTWMLKSTTLTAGCIHRTPPTTRGRAFFMSVWMESLTCLHPRALANPREVLFDPPSTRIEIETSMIDPLPVPNSRSIQESNCANTVSNPPRKDV